MDEQKRVTSLEKWYTNEQINFDKHLIYYRYKTIKNYLIGPAGLELGPGDGQMTQYLKDDFENLTLVDASQNLLNAIPDYPNVKKELSLFEEFVPTRHFNSIIMEHIIEHVADPIGLLKRVKNWLNFGDRVILGVPNSQSFHRLVATKMGLLKRPDELNSRDYALGHRRIYNMESLLSHIEEVDFAIIATGGVFFKPLSNSQIEQQWTVEMMDGFYELGKDFPEYAAEIYAVCSLPK